MRAHTPNDRSNGAAANACPGAAAAAQSSSRAHARSVSGSGIARPSSTFRESRSSMNSIQQTARQQQQQQHPRPSSRSSRNSAIPDTQSAGAPASSYHAVSHESGKENMAPADAEEYETQRRRIEELKAEVGTLAYKLSTFEQEREMARLQHESELRDARRKAEDDFKQRQAAEAAHASAERQLDQLQTELNTVRGDHDAQQQERERRLRTALDEAHKLREKLDDLSAAHEEEARRSAKQLVDAEDQVVALQNSLAAAKQEGTRADTALQEAQATLAARDAAVGQLEGDVLRLKAQTGDAATMAIIRRELKDQVNHIRALEATNRDQLTELRHLRQTHKAVAIVEEEKRSLLRRLEAAQALEKEFAEERQQRQRLESEHRAWAAYLQPEAGGNDAEFDSPAAMAKALMEERYRTAALTERIGAIESELAQRDADVRTLEAAKKALTAERDRLQTTPPSADSSGGSHSQSTGGDKVRSRLERQRALAVKEVAYLRAQLQALDSEDLTFHSEQFDQHKADRIQQLEDLVDKYRAEAEGLHMELTALEERAGGNAPGVPAAPMAGGGTKRPRQDDDDDAAETQVGQLARKTRQLQDALCTAQTRQRTLERELAVAQEQLEAETKAAGVRVLALRSNPTSDHEAVKQATLKALQTENMELLAHIQAHAASKGGASGSGAAALFTTVPMSVLTAAQREIAEAQAETASAQKTGRRLKEVWASKSAEFKEAVESTLGWHVTFIPNGKMRVESVYYPSETDECEKSIVFDGERGTMKVGGGPRSAFAQRIDDQIRFWVREKGCIPGFLAALTLEFYEEQARTAGNTAKVSVGR